MAIGFVPGYIVSAITFPGVMVHELAHQLFCRWTGTAVHKVCYFRFGNPAGYVIHEKPTSVWKHILIGIGPFFVNTLFGGALGLANYGLAHLKSPVTDFFLMVVMWLAVSIAMHSFPSTGDAKSIWLAIWGKDAPFSAKILGTPLVTIIYIGAFASVFWLDFFYGLVVVFGTPIILGIAKQ